MTGHYPQQLALFVTYSYHGFITDREGETLELEADHCRIRKDHAPQNLATLRQVSHNLLKNETSLKVGIQGKRLQAGWKEDYLLKVLRS